MASQHPNITGWGADLDHQNRPAYPKERTPPRLENVPWKYPQQQPVRVPVFHSIERPSITPVFGTSAPPRGVSGVIRKYAYTLSENDVRHWLLLLFADRVDVVEGIFGDVKKSKAAAPVAGLLTLAAAGIVAYGLLAPRRRFSVK